MTPYILLVVGLILVWLEFYLPGGILAVGAALFILGAQVSFYSQTGSMGFTFLFFVISCALTITTVYFAIQRIRKSADKNTFFLSKDQEGYKAASFAKELIGKNGVTLTEFGPSGYVLIDGERYAAVCRGPYLDKGEDVVVIAGESGYLVVKPIKKGN
jgi:membrane-bound ClpP family serine protease